MPSTAGRPAHPSPVARPRPAGVLAGLGVLAILGAAGLTALGIWQLERRVWKLDLIERVEVRTAAPVVPAPGPSDWSRISREADEYRHVRVTGTFDHDREVQTQAVTDLGSGFWIVTPLRTDDGFTVLVNRGFVPSDRRQPQTRTDGQVPGGVTVDGLLRISEPAGGFLRTNAPDEDRWYSRDVAAIAAARGLGDVAPYFIDADRAQGGISQPVGGLTVVSFNNNHAVYAVTWFTLAGMLLAGAAFVARHEWRLRTASSGIPPEAS